MVWCQEREDQSLSWASLERMPWHYGGIQPPRSRSQKQHRLFTTLWQLAVKTFTARSLVFNDVFAVAVLATKGQGHHKSHPNLLSPCRIDKSTVCQSCPCHCQSTEAITLRLCCCFPSAARSHLSGFDERLRSLQESSPHRL